MTNATAFRGLPTFPTALLSQSPILTGSFSIPTRLPPQIDTFSKESPLFRQITTTPGDGGLGIITSDASHGKRVSDILKHPARHLRDLTAHFDSAHEASLVGDVVSVERALGDAMKELRTPVSPESSQGGLAKPLHLQIEDGPDIMKEAGLAAAGFVSAENVPESLKWLHEFIGENPVDGKNPVDFVRAGLLRAYNTMVHAASAKNPPSTLFKRAVDIIDEVIGEVEKKVEDAEVRKEANFFATLLRIEGLSYQLVLAYNRKDRKARKACALEIRDTFHKLSGQYCTGEEARDAPKDAVKINILASYYADVSILMARLGLWHQSLARARTLTTRDGLKDTIHAKRLLENEIFKPFVNPERGKFGEIKQAGEIRRLMSSGALRRFLAAGVKNAHSQSIAHTAVIGGTGLVAGNLLDAYAQGGHGALTALGGAMLFCGIYRFIKGLSTDEARDAYTIGGEPMPTGIEVTKDIGKLALKSGIDTVVWALPAYLLDAGTNTLLTGLDTVANGYGTYGNWISRGWNTAWNPDTYVTLANSAAAALSDPSFYYGTYTQGSGLLYATHLLAPGLRKYTKGLMPFALPGAAMLGADAASWAVQSSPMEVLTAAYNLYTKAAGTLFATHLLFPGVRKDLDGLSKWFMLGAIGLSADIRQAYKHDVSFLAPDFFHPDWINGIFRASIVSAEAIGMMLITGMINWNKGETKLQTVKNFGSALWNSNKSMAIAIAVVNGITSPFGGAMQKQPYDHLGLIMMQGLATTIGVLPFTLGISGFIKGKVPFLSTAKEAWDDMKGQRIDKRLLETSLGAKDAFTMRYAQNRIGRIFLYDVIGATARTYLGWDTGYLSQMAMSAPNMVSGNGASTMTWSEPDGTKWQRAAILDLFEDAHKELIEITEQWQGDKITTAQHKAAEKAMLDKIHTTVSKAGKRMDPLHLFLDHERLRDRLLPLYAIKQTIWPGEFPSKTDTDYYASIHRMVKGGNIHAMLKDGNTQVEELTPEHVEVLLQYVETFASDIGSFKVIQPLIKVLAMARDNPETGKQIEDFFERNPWVFDLFNVDLDAYAPPKELSRRRTRIKVMSAIATPAGEFKERTMSHGRKLDLPGLYEGLFVDRPTPPEDPVDTAAMATSESVTTN